MTKKIESLTPEQEAKLDVYRDRWIEIGLACGPCDLEQAKPAVNAAYESANLAPPKHFFVAESPISGAIMAVILKGMSPMQIAEMEDKQDELKAMVKEYRESKSLNSKEIRDALNAQIFGSHDASWLAYNAYLLEVLGIEECGQLQGLMDLAKCCGWWAPYSEVAILQDRPCEIHFDDRDRLHNESGPALWYRDGFAVYAIHGIRVPEDLVMRPETNTVEAIENERNAEVRRIRIECYGFERYLEDAGINCVQQDDFGKLYRKETADDEPDLVFVEVVNSTPEPDGTYKKYVLPCRSTVKTAHEAVAQSFGLSVEEYCPEAES